MNFDAAGFAELEEADYFEVVGLDGAHYRVDMVWFKLDGVLGNLNEHYLYGKKLDHAGGNLVFNAQQVCLGRNEGEWTLPLAIATAVANYVPDVV